MTAGKNYTWGKKIFKNKAFEIQFCTEKGFSDWFGFKIYTKSECDHPGFYFEFEFLKRIYFHIWIYDIRHWDYDKECFEEN